LGHATTDGRQADLSKTSVKEIMYAPLNEFEVEGEVLDET